MYGSKEAYNDYQNQQVEYTPELYLRGLLPSIKKDEELIQAHKEAGAEGVVSLINNPVKS